MDDVLTMIDWLSERLGEPHLLVAWQVTMASVVNIFSNTEDQWVIELIKLIVVKVFIVLNTISVQISDSTTMPSLLTKLGLYEVQVFWRLDIVDKESESILFT